MGDNGRRMGDNGRRMGTTGRGWGTTGGGWGMGGGRGTTGGGRGTTGGGRVDNGRKTSDGMNVLASGCKLVTYLSMARPSTQPFFSRCFPLLDLAVSQMVMSVYDVARIVALA